MCPVPTTNPSDWLSVVLGCQRPPIHVPQLSQSVDTYTHPEPVSSRRPRYEREASEDSHIPDSPTPDILPRSSSPSSSPHPNSRYPNGFLLFRSYFLKRNLIPKDVEKRQHSLSRVVGQIWTLMPEDQKTAWKKKAKEDALRRTDGHLSYKLARAARRAKAKKPVDREAEAKQEYERAMMLREFYTGVKGDVKPPVRVQKMKKPKKEGSMISLSGAVSRDSSPIDVRGFSPSLSLVMQDVPAASRSPFGEQRYSNAPAKESVNGQNTVDSGGYVVETPRNDFHLANFDVLGWNSTIPPSDAPALIQSTNDLQPSNSLHDFRSAQNGVNSRFEGFRAPDRELCSKCLGQGNIACNGQDPQAGWSTHSNGLSGWSSI
ncbi:hypothetical protein CVT26_000816 [Gymnopilus dilepis]|uniref:HMG box domain-containing protein n=1 Tax=Gymnopilus dilepis TaxID=231916 RepID=A0A409X3M9_9AGAR|nr:hypothetical protein CVT26_000816 [Gymnopilus dilepis]